MYQSSGGCQPTTHFCQRWWIKHRLLLPCPHTYTPNSPNRKDSYPLVNCPITMENHNFFYGKINYKWQFLIAMFVYQRVYVLYWPKMSEWSYFVPFVYGSHPNILQLWFLPAVSMSPHLWNAHPIWKYFMWVKQCHNPWLGMVNIPPIKMVMTGGWCKWHCFIHIKTDKGL